MIRSGKLNDKRILLVDKEEKNKNDHTWCFWEIGEGLFENIVYNKWERVWFRSNGFSRLMQLSPYNYKLIRSIDFYTYCFDLIRKQPNIDVLFGEINQVVSTDSETFIELNNKKICCDYIFNSIIFQKSVLKKNEYYLLQHFKGWVIETRQPVFNAEEAVLMDFRVGQEHGTTFIYIMPFSAASALVEYTVFSNQLLEQEQYAEALKNYIRDFLGNIGYEIKEQEFGIIPMTNHKFPARQNNIINIGTAGGQTKASSGYTFQFIQKHSAAIVGELITKGHPFISEKKRKRFHFYDSVLLNILHHKKIQGKKIFTDLFKKNKPQHVLRFLDNESSFPDELKIISSLPTMPFLKAALKQL